MHRADCVSHFAGSACDVCRAARPWNNGTDATRCSLPEHDAERHPRHCNHLKHHGSGHGSSAGQSKLHLLQSRRVPPHPPRRWSWPDLSRRLPATKRRDVNKRELTGLGAWTSRPVDGKPRRQFESVQTCAAGRGSRSRRRPAEAPILAGTPAPRRVWGVNDSVL